MQATELDTTVAPLRNPTSDRGLKLVIANKNYSSWSMRPWVLMTAFNIPFETIQIWLNHPDTAAQIEQYSPSGRIPVLLANEGAIWDTLSICEYLAEQFPDKQLWPKAVAARAMARSICAEMHSSFTGLRSAMPMNIRARFPGKGRTIESQGDIGRVCEIWETCLTHSGPNQFLFGDFSIADAFFAPVVMRFRTYDVSLAPALQAYADRVAAHPAVAQWVREALEEKESIAYYDVLPD